MMPRLSARIGVIAFILVLVIALGAVMVNAQSPTVTVTPTTVTVTPTDTDVATASPTNTPAISSFTVDVAEAANQATPTNTADVTLTVELNNVELSTATPGTAAEDGTVQGLIKYCYDQEMATPGASPAATAMPTMTAMPTDTAASPGASAAAIPTATVNTTMAVPGSCILSTETSFTFTEVPAGMHTFTVELVRNDGTSMEPRLYVNIEMNVVPTSGGGGLFGDAK